MTQGLGKTDPSFMIKLLFFSPQVKNHVSPYSFLFFTFHFQICENTHSCLAPDSNFEKQLYFVRYILNSQKEVFEVEKCLFKRARVFLLFFSVCHYIKL